MSNGTKKIQWSKDRWYTRSSVVLLMGFVSFFNNCLGTLKLMWFHRLYGWNFANTVVNALTSLAVMAPFVYNKYVHMCSVQSKAAMPYKDTTFALECIWPKADGFSLV